ncbi:kinase-like domain-containing protein [Rhizophagus clarus]|uniref:Kinase-like domain-containing protein n=1 Tax=Rhizophagus clarus TaxID=94130 RepID=A0A8H3QUX9_9GLOM|nr:kinase-like domain-containing protein [Rhizophagus clarus]
MSNNIEHKNSINSNEWNKWIQEANSIKEIVHEHQIGFHNNIIRFYGITDKIMKIKLASKLSSAVLCLHDKGIVHRDLLIWDFQREFKNQIYNQNYMKWSLMLIQKCLTIGRPPFCNEPCDGGNLATKILHGLREAPIPGTLECCINIHTDCWNSEPDNRPAINQVVGRLKTLNTSNNKCNSNVDIQLSSEQQLNLKSNVFEVSKDIIYSSHCSHENLSQFIRNFDKINIKEIEPLTSIIPINIIVDEILYILNKLEKVDERREILNYLNNYNMTPQEIYYWLLNNQDNSNSVLLLGVFYYLGIGC